MSSVLQNLFVQPRDTSNPKFARLSQTNRTEVDGVLYDLVDPREYSTYRILSQEEVRNENRKIVEMARTVNTWQGKGQLIRPGSANSPSYKFQPPKLGMLSKSGRIEKKKWENQVKALKSGNDDTIKLDGTMKQLLANSQTERKESEYQTTSSNQHEDEPDLNLLVAVDVLKSKYFENIQVIETLYNEKCEMEKKMKAMERSLIRNNINIEMNQGDNLLPNNNEYHENEQRNEIDEYLNRKQQNPLQNKLLTASEVAQMLGEENDDYSPIKPKKDNSFKDSFRSMSAGPSKRFGNQNSFESTSRSRPTSAHRKFNISTSLQADVDK